MPAASASRVFEYIVYGTTRVRPSRLIALRRRKSGRCDASRGNGRDRGVRAGGRKPWRDASKERFWRQAVAEQRRCGQTVRAYCAQHGFSEPSFYAWRSELARRAKERKVAVRPGRRSGSEATS